MQPSIDSIRRQVATVAAARRQTDETERRILESAEQRLESVEARLKELRSTVLSQQDHADEYMSLTEERGHLHRVIANSKRHLGGRGTSRDSTVSLSTGPTR